MTNYREWYRRQWRRPLIIQPLKFTLEFLPLSRQRSAHWVYGWPDVGQGLVAAVDQIKNRLPMSWLTSQTITMVHRNWTTIWIRLDPPHRYRRCHQQRLIIHHRINHHHRTTPRATTSLVTIWWISASPTNSCKSCVHLERRENVCKRSCKTKDKLGSSVSRRVVSAVTKLKYRDDGSSSAMSLAKVRLYFFSSTVNQFSQTLNCY